MREFVAIVTPGPGAIEIVEIIRAPGVVVEPGQAIPVWFVSYERPRRKWWQFWAAE